MKQIVFLILFALFAWPTFAQSTNENFPTPLLENEISGTIAARDIGDSRLTHYFYTFFADNGDVNLTVETANFDGDIDLFEAVTLRPLMKITVVADSQPAHTSRAVYFRKRTQVVLRIEGRSLTNDAAAYRIAFSGTFAAAANLPQTPADAQEPKVAEKSTSDAIAKVNSAGAIIEVLKPPITKLTSNKPTVEKSSSSVARRAPIPKKPVARAKPNAKPVTPKTENPTENTLGNSAAKLEESVAAKKPAAKTTKPKAAPASRALNAKRAPNPRKSVGEKTDASAAAASNVPPAAYENPLASVQLIILLKNGERVTRVMSEVFNIRVDKGQITVITKNGKIERYNLLDIQKMTIE